VKIYLDVQDTTNKDNVLRWKEDDVLQWIDEEFKNDEIKTAFHKYPVSGEALLVMKPVHFTEMVNGSTRK
jgi:hypothetical protein